ncbi:ArsR/SmtB family transcription factor [Streptomyces sp. NPDC092296]|uniref:ArsR/SmtB family transcription factor n=1 Tax=Streptomyces sp. NPDC092296 TaxID=3366012 RepID=UPI0037F90C2E
MLEQAQERQVDDVATLKALADPLRLAILDALMARGSQPLTVKEIAAALHEPQTKLYRHVKQLEKAKLITVAGTRLVSGIVESRYTAAQRSLRLSRDLFSATSAERSEALDALLAAIDRVRGDFRGNFLDGRIDFAAPQDGSAGPTGLFGHFTVWLDPDRLVRLRRRLADVLDKLQAEGDSSGPDAVPVTLLTLLYGLSPRPTGADDGADGAGSDEAGPDGAGSDGTDG